MKRFYTSVSQRRVLFLAWIILHAITMTLYAQQNSTKVEWEFKNNSELPSSELRSALPAVMQFPVSTSLQSDVTELLRKKYYEEGFYRFRIDSLHTAFSVESSSMKISVFLEEGSRAMMHQMLFIGADSLSPSRLQKEISLRAGSVFSSAALLLDIGALLSFYENQGYPFTSIHIEDIHVFSHHDSDFVDVTLGVVEGNRFIIEEISIEGNEVTDADVIVREMRIEKSEPFQPHKIDAMRRRVSRLDFLTAVSEPTLYQRGSVHGVRLRVEEGNANRFDGVLGYQPSRSAEQSGYFIGLVHLSFKNIFGTGRAFFARWERASVDVQELALRYLEPWLFQFPLNAEGGFYQRQQDSMYVSRAFDAQLSFMLTDNIHVRVLGKNTSVIPTQQDGGVRVARSSTLSVGGELVIDTRNNVINPTSGIYFSSGFTGGNKNVDGTTGSEATYIQHLSFDASYVVEILPRHVITPGVHGREVRGSMIDASDYYRIGGARTLRGYREEQFHVTSAAWTNLEYRFLLSARTFAFAFFDYGYLASPAIAEQNITAQALWKSGYGAGLRLDTSIGIIAVSYALGNGDAFADGKIHFGLVNEF